MIANGPRLHGCACSPSSDANMAGLFDWVGDVASSAGDFFSNISWDSIVDFGGDVLDVAVPIYRLKLQRDAAEDQADLLQAQQDAIKRAQRLAAEQLQAERDAQAAIVQQQAAAQQAIVQQAIAQQNAAIEAQQPGILGLPKSATPLLLGGAAVVLLLLSKR